MKRVTYMIETQDASTLTNVCVDENLPEIEVISLVCSQLPNYRLRASTATNFTHYNHQDFGIAPPLPAPSELGLTNTQIDQVLKYFVLCGERVSQMTRVYDDIEAVTQLLEEKERDLELAARIGQSLLEQNKHLSLKCDQLEVEVNAYCEQSKQIKHELCQKEQLLQLLTSDEVQKSRENSPVVEHKQSKYVEVVQKKLAGLEDDNQSLRDELFRLQSETEHLEEQERRLTRDCVHQLSEAQRRVRELQTELDRKTLEIARLQEQSAAAMQQLATGQHKTKELTIENMDMKESLRTAGEIQHELTTELFELKEKYRECKDLLDSTKEELDQLKIRSSPRAATQRYFSMPYMMPPQGSFAAELESLNEPEKQVKRRSNSRVIETAQYVRKLSSRPPSLHSSISSTTSARPPTGRQLLMSAPIPGSVPVSKPTSRSVTRPQVTNKSGSRPSFLSGPNFFDEIDKHRAALGKPGIPGSRDLDKALKRLSLRRQNELSERQYAESQLRAETDRLKAESQPNQEVEDMDWQQHSATPTERSPSPESELSGYGSASSFSFRMPEKLQIIKPMEGSATLHHWQRLATPNLAGIFEERDGVQIKHEQQLDDVTESSYSLLDHEEEDLRHKYETCSTFTVTDARVMHPTTTHVNPFIQTSPAVLASTITTASSAHRYSIVSRLGLPDVSRLGLPDVSRLGLPDVSSAESRALDSLIQGSEVRGSNTGIQASSTPAKSHSMTSNVSTSMSARAATNQGTPSMASSIALANRGTLSMASVGSNSQGAGNPGLFSGIYQYFNPDPVTATTNINGLNTVMTSSLFSKRSGIQSRWNF